jgi:hypothetical protein
MKFPSEHMSILVAYLIHEKAKDDKVLMMDYELVYTPQSWYLTYSDGDEALTYYFCKKYNINQKEFNLSKERQKAKKKIHNLHKQIKENIMKNRKEISIEEVTQLLSSQEEINKIINQ